MFAMFKKRSAEPLTLERKLAILAECGLSLAPPFTVQHLLEFWSREQFEEPGFTMALVGLGMTEEEAPWRNHCVNAWHFDTECIEDNGSYVRIAERMAELTQGGLAIEDVRDRVDLEEEVATLDFVHDGNPVHLDLQVNGDWVDPAVLTHFVRVLANADASKVFLHHDIQGQNCVIACVTREQFAALRKAGVSFEPLK